MDEHPDFIVVLGVPRKRRFTVRMMRWDPVADDYVVRMEWLTPSKREAQAMAQDWSEQRGVEWRR